MKNLQSVICVVLFLSFGVLAQTDSASREKKAKEKIPPLTSQVILISIDGLRIEDLTNSKLNLPNLKALHEGGAFALNVESVYPSQSIPAHASIVTGMLPADHGISGNAPFDEKKARTITERYSYATDLKADTIWQAAKRAGLETAAINFPFAEKSEIDFISQTLTTELIEQNRPQLLMIKFDEVADALQQFGLGTIEVAMAMEKVDASLKTVLSAVEKAGLTNETTFLIVSSHGYAKVEQEFRPNVILARKGFLTADTSGNITSWIAAARTFDGVAAIYLQDQQNEEMTKSLEEIFIKVYQQEASPIWRVLSKKDAAKLGADPRAALFLEAAPGFIISEQATGRKFTEKLHSSARRGTSGYLPSRSEMRGMFIAAGKGIKPNTRIEYARLVDIAPTIARLLGLELKTSRGHAISGIFTQ